MSTTFDLFKGHQIEVKCWAANNDSEITIEEGRYVKMENIRFKVYERSLCGNTTRLSIISFDQTKDIDSPEE